MTSLVGPIRDCRLGDGRIYGEGVDDLDYRRQGENVVFQVSTYLTDMEICSATQGDYLKLDGK